MTTAEYATKYGVSSETVRRWIRDGKIPATRKDGVWHISDEAHHTHATDAPQHNNHVVDSLLVEREARIVHLEKMLDQANEAQARSDTIILGLTQQLDRAHLQLEDMRQPNKTVWQRFKAVFATA